MNKVAESLSYKSPVLFWVKWIALYAMVLDHFSLVFGVVPEFRLIGRLAFPVFALLVGYNAETFFSFRSAQNWVDRLMFYAFVSQVPYYLVFGTMQLNILFTLLLGLLVLRVYGWFHYAVVSVLVGLSLLQFLGYGAMGLEYGPSGVLLVYSAGLFFRNGNLAFWFYSSLCISQMIWFNFIVTAMVLPVFVVMVVLVKGSASLPRVKKFFYVFYPMHLLILYGVEKCLSF